MYTYHTYIVYKIFTQSFAIISTWSYVKPSFSRFFSTSRMHYVKHIEFIRIEIHKKHLIRDCIIVYKRDQTEHTIIKWSHYYKNVFTVGIKCFLNSFSESGKTEVEVEVETEAKNAHQMLNAKSVKYIVYYFIEQEYERKKKQQTQL